MTNDVDATPEAGEEALRITKAEFGKEFLSVGLNAKYLAKKIKRGTNAKKQDTHFEKGEWYYSKRFPDHQIQYKYVDMAVRITDGYPTEKHKVEHEGMVYLAPEPIKTPKKAGT